MANARLGCWEMQKKNHEFQPCVICYICFIKGHRKEKDFRNVDVILDEMQENGCEPNVVSYTIIMHALGKAKQTNKALEVYEINETESMSARCFVLQTIVDAGMDTVLGTLDEIEKKAWMERFGLIPKHDAVKADKKR
ncbi:Pentatricopeptide repeat-containing protein At3g22670, mitochondrial [Linum grandiflorum]